MLSLCSQSYSVAQLDGWFGPLWADVVWRDRWHEVLWTGLAGCVMYAKPSSLTVVFKTCRTPLYADRSCELVFYGLWLWIPVNSCTRIRSAVGTSCELLHTDHCCEGLWTHVCDPRLWNPVNTYMIRFVVVLGNPFFRAFCCRENLLTPACGPLSWKHVNPVQQRSHADENHVKYMHSVCSYCGNLWTNAGIIFTVPFREGLWTQYACGPSCRENLRTQPGDEQSVKP